MVALPQSPAALPTHVLAAWSSPSSAASSSSSPSSALLRAYAAASARQLSSPSSSASTSAASSASSSASTSPLSSRRSSFAEDDWKLAQAVGSLDSWFSSSPASSRRSSFSSSPPRMTEDQPAEEEEEEEEEGKDPRLVRAGHLALKTGNDEEDMVLRKLREAKARNADMGDAQRHGTNDSKTDLSMRPKSGFMHVYYSIQVKVSGSEQNGYYQPAQWAVDYEGVLMWYHNTELRFILVGLAEELPAKSGGVASLLKRAEHLLVTYKDGPEERERAYREAAGILINRITDSAVYEKPDLTENQRTEQKGLATIHRLCSRNPSLRYAPSDDGHSKHDFIVGDELMQMKSLSYKSELPSGHYCFPLFHIVNGVRGVSYDTNMGLALVVVECKTGFYMLTPQQARTEGLTGVFTLNKTVTLPRPDKCSPQHPFFKYIFPVPKKN